MKLYVGTYKKYNEGSLFGKWIDLNDFFSREDFLEECFELHNDEEDPELMFQDCECDNKLEEQFYNESYIDESYWDYHDAIERSNLDADVIAEWLSKNSLEPTVENIEKAEDLYIGHFDSAESFAESEYEQSTQELPSIILNAIDWTSVAEELSYEYDFVETDQFSDYGLGHKVVVFSQS